MKVAIIGAGPGGSTLYRLLKDKYQVDLFGKKVNTTCGCRPCAWGVNPFSFRDICQYIGLNEDFCLSHFNKTFIQGVRSNRQVSVIDKPLLLKSLIGGAEVKYETCDFSRYDRIVDATGTGDILGGRYKDSYRSTFQVKAKVTRTLDLSVRIIDSLIMWVFPLSEEVIHIGIISMAGDRNLSMNLLQECLVRNGLGNLIGRIDCSCNTKVWYGGLKPPFIRGNIWGLGEAIGLVDPISGSGILPAMVSARLVYENWTNPEGYAEAIKHRFKYISSGAKVLHNKYLSLRNLHTYLSERSLRGLSLSPVTLVQILVRNPRLLKVLWEIREGV